MDPSEDTILRTALDYATLGWAVLPVHTVIRGECTCGRSECSTPGKHPRVSWREFSEIPPTIAQVRTWFGDEFYGSNLGTVTGSASGLVVVDCDGPEGIKSADTLNLPIFTLTARTGGGGLHRFYRLEGSEVPSRRGALHKVDIKSELGFVVLPPSLHVSGRRYRWRYWVRPVPCDLSTLAVSEGSALEGGSTWYHELLDGVPEGSRSLAAARLAGRYLNLGLSSEETYLILVTWNARNDPPLPRSDLKATVRSVARKHAEESVPETIETLEELVSSLQALDFSRGE